MTGHANAISAAQFCSDGRLATADEAGLIQIWDVQTGKLLNSLDKHQLGENKVPVRSLEWSADGKRLLAGGQKIALWDVKRETASWSLDIGHDDVYISFSPDERLVAAAIGTRFFVFDAENRTELCCKVIHTQPVLGIQWIEGPAWKAPVATLAWLDELVRWRKAEPWQAEGKRLLLLTWSGDGTARVWDWENQREILRMIGPGSLYAAATKNGSKIVTADYNGTLRVWPAWLDNPNALLASAQSLTAHRSSR